MGYFAAVAINAQTLGQGTFANSNLLTLIMILTLVITLTVSLVLIPTLTPSLPSTNPNPNSTLTGRE